MTVRKVFGSRNGKVRVMDGAKCRQCLLCRRWYHIGWFVRHVCRVDGKPILPEDALN